MSSRRKTPPKRVYLEVWPADSGMSDQLSLHPPLPSPPVAPELGKVER